MSFVLDDYGNVTEINGITIADLIDTEHGQTRGGMDSHRYYSRCPFPYDTPVGKYVRNYMQQVFNEFISSYNYKRYNEKAVLHILEGERDFVFYVARNYPKEIELGLNLYLCSPAYEEKSKWEDKNVLSKITKKQVKKTNHEYTIFKETKEGPYREIIAYVKLGDSYSKEQEQKSLRQAVFDVMETQNDPESKDNTIEYMSALCHIPGGREALKSELESGLKDIEAFSEKEKKENAETIDSTLKLIDMYNKISDEKDAIAVFSEAEETDEKTATIKQDNNKQEMKL